MENVGTASTKDNSYGMNLKTLSILTLILVPLIPSAIMFSILKSGPEIPMVGTLSIFIFFVVGSVFAGVIASIQLQLKQNDMGKEGFLIEISPFLSIILSLAVLIIYLGYMYEQGARKILAYGSSYIVFNRYAILFVYMPLFSLYTAILIKRNKKGRFTNLLSNISYVGYILSPILFLMFWRRVI